MDDIDAAFGCVTKLKFTQPATLAGLPAAAALAARLGLPPSALRVTPFPAGHMLGGCVWRMEVGGEELVYAVDTNHRNER